MSWDKLGEAEKLREEAVVAHQVSLDHQQPVVAGRAGPRMDQAAKLDIEIQKLLKEADIAVREVNNNHTECIRLINQAMARVIYRRELKQEQVVSRNSIEEARWGLQDKKREAAEEHTLEDWIWSHENGANIELYESVIIFDKNI